MVRNVDQVAPGQGPRAGLDLTLTVMQGRWLEPSDLAVLLGEEDPARPTTRAIPRGELIKQGEAPLEKPVD